MFDRTGGSGGSKVVIWRVRQLGELILLEYYL